MLLVACAAEMVAQSGGNQNCKELRAGATATAALAYLSGKRDALNSGCITRALYILGRAGYKPAAPWLIEYLGFEDPAILAGAKMVRQGGVYPAEALRSAGWFAPRTRLSVRMRNQVTRLMNAPLISTWMVKRLFARSPGPAGLSKLIAIDRDNWQKNARGRPYKRAKPSLLFRTDCHH